MRAPEAIPFRGRAKWGEVAGNVLLAALGSLLAWVAFSQVPANVLPVRVAAWFTLFAVVITLVLVLALVVTRQMPTVEPHVHDGKAGFEVHAWRGDWWHAIGLDLGLGTAGVVICVLAVRAGSDWLLGALVVGTLGAWFLIRALLAVVGRRRNEALLFLDDYVIHRTPAGWSGCPGSSVQAVRGRGNAVVLILDSPAVVTECPALWRGSRRIAADSMVVRCSMMGHTAEALADWLQDALGLNADGEPQQPHRRR
ncbi:hypothetical protein OG984_16585 [Nocardioides sp. NBC_00368]|uniref:hypothetical protein n=1 Tax=Nocardioides sp. NBC_00368 TaxID=2976000 RepID=UPI002E2353DD